MHTRVLAAAVSDFQIPENKLAEHKIASGGTLDLKMEAVPKKLGDVKKWNPDTTLISFKLETDASKLEGSAKDAMNKGKDAATGRMQGAAAGARGGGNTIGRRKN